MSTTRRQFVQSLAIVPFVPVAFPEAKPAWYVPPSDPVFDTPVLSTGERWSEITDLTQTPTQSNPGPLVSLRDLDLSDPRMGLGVVTRHLSSLLREFAMTLSGAPGVKHVSQFEDYYAHQEGTHTALAIASMHLDAGDEVVDYVGYVNGNMHGLDPDWREVCLGDILDLREAFSTASSDEEVSRLRERVLEMLVFGAKYRVYDLTREGEHGEDQAVGLFDRLCGQGRSDLALAASDISLHAEWQVEHQSEEGSRARFVLLGEDIGAIIPWDGGHFLQLWDQLTHSIEDLHVIAKHLHSYCDSDSEEVWVNEHYWVRRTGALDYETFHTLQNEMWYAEENPDYQIFTNFKIECANPTLQARIHVFENYSGDALEAEREAYDREHYA